MSSASIAKRILVTLTWVLVFTHHSLGLPLDLNSEPTNTQTVDLSPESSSWLEESLTALTSRSLAADTPPESPSANILVTVMRRATRFWEPWELNHNICPPSICTASDEIKPRGTGGSVFYNGDIVLDKDSEKIIYKNSLRQRWRRTKRATNKRSRLWKNGIVPYMFGEIADKSKRYIKKAMRAIENNTCVRFRKKKLRDTDYIRFISEPGCWSNVGRVGGEQKVSIGRGCERLGTAIHEISHALGFWHEQARPDRDQFIEIITANISPRYLPDFEKADPDLVTSRGFPYDYESVMHYSKKAFTNLGEITIKVIGVGKKLNMSIGQREMLSTIDIAQLRDMYNCNEKEDDKVTYNWVKKDRSCYKFEPTMREQFSGAQRHCETLNSRLLAIETSRENKVIKNYIKKKFPEVKAWRTGGRIVNGTFKWYVNEKNADDMEYTNWGKGQPSTYSSLALVYSQKRKRVKWQGVWLGSANQMPDHAYAVICERRAKRKCIPGAYKDGRDYRGKLDHTIDGILCQKWTSQYPHTHKLPTSNLKGTSKEDKDGLGDHSFCRNPSGDRKSRPWCYTNKKNFKWQYCDISVCSGSVEKSQDQRQKGDLVNAKPPKNDRNTNSVDVDKNQGTSIKNGYNKNRNDILNDSSASNKLNIKDDKNVTPNTFKNKKTKNKTDKNRRKGKKDNLNGKDKNERRRRKKD